MLILSDYTELSRARLDLNVISIKMSGPNWSCLKSYLESHSGYAEFHIIHKHSPWSVRE